MKSLETLCEGRSKPLLCGCVKSSIGHTEATSGLCSIAKVIIAMERGLIPPNINFSEPQKGITALQESKIRVSISHFVVSRVTSGQVLFLKSYVYDMKEGCEKAGVPLLDSPKCERGQRGEVSVHSNFFLKKACFSTIKMAAPKEKRTQKV